MKAQRGIMVQGELDEKDKKILAVLKRNARAPVTEISKATGLQKDSIHYRLKRLERERKITYSISLNSDAQFKNIISLGLRTLDIKTEKALDELLDTLPEVVSVFKTTGRYDYHITCATRSMDEFTTIRRKICVAFAHVITLCDISAVVERR